MSLSILLLLGGALALYFGAEWIVRGGSQYALRLGLSPTIVGLTIVAFGTSLPELIVSLIAALEETNTIAIGNIVGSNVANVGLVLGLSAFIFPVTIVFSKIKYDLVFYMVVCAFFVWFCWNGFIGRGEGIILFIGIILYTSYCFLHPQGRVEVVNEGTLSTGKCIVLLISGVLLLGVGAYYFIDGAVQMARFLGVSEIVIGMSIVALGTSLPELATSVVAAFRKESGISIGNIIGSNLFNILSVIGLVSILHPLTVPTSILYREVPFMIAFGVVLFPLAIMRQPISRINSSLLIIGYGLFLWILF